LGSTLDRIAKRARANVYAVSEFERKWSNINRELVVRFYEKLKTQLDDVKSGGKKREVRRIRNERGQAS
jgi:hypothetical protein